MVINLVDPVVDAGDVAEVVHATVDSLESVPIATFDHDVMYDFRAQRPIVAYADGKLVDMIQPMMHIDLITDMHGEKFLYVCGQEPDFRWNAITSDLLEIIERYGVAEVFSFAGMPAGVPHTRPADMVIRSTIRTDIQTVHGTAEHFAQLQDFFEYEAGKHGVSVTNIRVRVPFYMAKGPFQFVSGALAIVKMMASLGGPTLPLGDLEQLEDQQIQSFRIVVEPDSDFAQLLTHLEEEYDKLPSNAGVVRPVDSVPQVPSAEEISRAAEQFLATVIRDPLEGVGSSSAVDVDKNKDCDGRDFVPDTQSSLRTSIVDRLRRGKHHRN